MEIHELPTSNDKNATWYKETGAGNKFASGGNIIVVLIPKNGELSGQLGESAILLISTNQTKTKPKNNDYYKIENIKYTTVNQPTLVTCPGFVSYYRIETKIKNAT